MKGIKDAKRIVFKVGTSTLTYPETGKVNIRRMSSIVRVLSDISNSGIDVALVTSGAIGVGAGKMGMREKPRDTVGRQAAACVGQCELMFMYDKLFSEYGKIIGQLLITKSDVENPERCLNLTNAFSKMFEYNTIPVINENDSVAVEEIVYGDNDSLSATVATLINADALIILSDIDGLYTANPQEDDTAQLIPVVRKIDESIFALASGPSSNCGTGGMITKIHAADIATGAGIDTILLNGANVDDVYKLLDGRGAGTHFCAQKKSHE